MRAFPRPVRQAAASRLLQDIVLKLVPLSTLPQLYAPFLVRGAAGGRAAVQPRVAAMGATAALDNADPSRIEQVLGKAEEPVLACEQACSQGSEACLANERSLELLLSNMEANDKRRAYLKAEVEKLWAEHESMERDSLLGQVASSVDKVASVFVFGNDRRKHSSFPDIYEQQLYGELDEEEQKGYTHFCAWLNTFGSDPDDLIYRTNLLREKGGPSVHDTPGQPRRTTREELVQWAGELGAEEAEDVPKLLTLLDGLTEVPGCPLCLSMDKVNETIARIRV